MDANTLKGSASAENHSSSDPQILMHTQDILAVTKRQILNQ